MFTGIIEETGTVRHVSLSGNSGRIQIGAELVLSGTRPGDSIAVNGVCLTVTTMDTKSFTADVMAETLRRSNLGQLKAGDLVNLERAMPADGRFGGHIVSGHIDGTGTIAALEQEGNATWVYVRTSPDILALIVEKGSIAIDGIYLTQCSASTARTTTKDNQAFGASVFFFAKLTAKVLPLYTFELRVSRTFWTDGSATSTKE